MSSGLLPCESPGLSPKEDGTNSVAQLAMDLQGTEAGSSDLHDMVGHVINSLHQTEVERDETQIETLRQSELTMLVPIGPQKIILGTKNIQFCFQLQK